MSSDFPANAERALFSNGNVVDARPPEDNGLEACLHRVHVALTRAMDAQGLSRLSHIDIAVDARVGIDKVRAYLIELERRKIISVSRPRLGGRRAVYRVRTAAAKVLQA